MEFITWDRPGYNIYMLTHDISQVIYPGGILRVGFINQLH